MVSEALKKASEAKKENGPKIVRHTVRSRDGGTRTFSHFTRAKAIKVHCTECMGWSEHPDDCTSKKCGLFPYRGITQSTQHSNED